VNKESGLMIKIHPGTTLNRLLQGGDVSINLVPKKTVEVDNNDLHIETTCLRASSRAEMESALNGVGLVCSTQNDHRLTERYVICGVDWAKGTDSTILTLRPQFCVDSKDKGRLRYLKRMKHRKLKPKSYYKK